MMKDYAIRTLLALTFVASGVCFSKHTVLGFVFYFILFMAAWMLLWAYSVSLREK